MSGCRSERIRMFFWGREGPLYLLVPWTYFWGPTLLEKSSLTACPVSIHAVCAQTVRGAAMQTSSREGAGAMHPCCTSASLVWGAVRTSIHWLLVLPILLISTNSWRSMLVTSVGGGQIVVMTYVCLPECMYGSVIATKTDAMASILSCLQRIQVWGGAPYIVGNAEVLG